MRGPGRGRGRGREGKGSVRGQMQAHDNKDNGMLDVQKRVFIWMHYYSICDTCTRQVFGTVAQENVWMATCRDVGFLIF